MAGDHARARSVERNSTLMPTAFAIIEAVQWLASTGGSVRGQRHNTLGYLRAEWWNTRGSSLIAQEPALRLHEAFLPAPHAASSPFQSAA